MGDEEEERETHTKGVQTRAPQSRRRRRTGGHWKGQELETRRSGAPVWAGLRAFSRKVHQIPAQPVRAALAEEAGCLCLPSRPPLLPRPTSQGRAFAF